jgi:integrase
MAENLLTHQRCMKAKPTAKVQRLRDGKGVFLTVEPSGSKYFVLRYKPMRPDGTRGDTYLGLGAFPGETTLDAAREKAAELRAVIKTGGDPRAHIKVEQAKAARAAATTFRVVADEYMARNKPKWSGHHYERNEGLLRRILLDDLGDLPVDQIDRAMMLKPLEDYYDAGRKESARRARALAALVFEHAIDTHRASRNPARELERSSLLAPVPVKHHAAMERQHVGAFLRKLAASKIGPVVSAGLRVMILTGLRDAALRGAKWSEVDLDGAVWTLPKGRQKARRDFKVPLPTQAVAALRELAKLTDKGPTSFIFASDAAEAGHIAENTLRAAVHSCGFKVTAHGFRALVKTTLTLAEYPKEWISKQLDHSDKDKLDAAYQRSDLLEKRAPMMQAWANWVERQESEADAPAALPENVVQFRLPSVA